MRSSPSAPLDRALAPAPSALRVAFLAARFAHRGLHGPEHSENGLPAVAAAVRQGDGIECDVRLSRDGEAIVFHDAELRRMTGRGVPLLAWTVRDAAGLHAARRAGAASIYEEAGGWTLPR